MPLTASWGPFTLRLPFSPLSSLPPFISSMPELRAQLLATAGLLAALPPVTALCSVPLRVALPARGCNRLSGEKNMLLSAPCKGKTSFPGFTSGSHVSKAEGMKTVWLATLPSLWAPKNVRWDGAISFKHWDYVPHITKVVYISKEHWKTCGSASECKKMLHFHRRHISHCYQ